MILTKGRKKGLNGANFISNIPRASAEDIRQNITKINRYEPASKKDVTREENL